MRKVILIACVAALLVTMLAVSASATDTVWAVLIKAYDGSFGSSQNTVELGLRSQATALTTTESNAPASGTAGATIQFGGTNYSKRRLPAATNTPTPEVAVTWDLKIGSGSAIGPVKVAVYNQILDGFNANQTVAQGLAYQFKMGDTVLASWSTAAVRAEWLANSQTLANWYALDDAANGLMRAKGWVPTASDSGYVYTIANPATGTTWDSLGSFSFSAMAVPPAPVVTPEPGSLLALGSGLVGFAGFALRRRRA